MKRNLHGVPSRDPNSGLPYSKPTQYLLSYSAPYWGTPHPTELRRTLLSYAAPYWDTPHPSELRRTVLSYAVPYWATPHPLKYAAPYTELQCTLLSYTYPIELRRTVTELRRTLLSYATNYWATDAPYWSTLHPTELHVPFWATPILLRYAATYWAMPHPTDIIFIVQKLLCNDLYSHYFNWITLIIDLHLESLHMVLKENPLVFDEYNFFVISWQAL